MNEQITPNAFSDMLGPSPSSIKKWIEKNLISIIQKARLVIKSEPELSNAESELGTAPPQLVLVYSVVLRAELSSTVAAVAAK